MKLIDNGYFIGTDASSPQVGDLQISYKVAQAGPVSVIGRQAKQSLESYTARAGGTIEMLEVGRHSAREMFATAREHNMLLTWGLRGAGWLVMWLGLCVILRPVAVVADVVPLVGNLVEDGIAIVAAVVALFGTMMVIAIGWLYFRPMVSIIVGAAAIGVVAIALRLKTKRARPE